MSRTSRRRSRGFSLVEVVICLGLLSVGLMATLAASLSCSQLQQTSRASTKANALLSDVLEHYRSIGSSGLRTHLTTTIPTTSPADRLGEYVVSGQYGAFTITGAVDSDGDVVPTELKGATVNVIVLRESNNVDPTVPNLNTLMPADLDGNGTLGEYPADVQDLDGDGDPDTSDFAAYSIVPIQVTITFPLPTARRNAGKDEVQQVTLTTCTVIYPTTVGS